MDFNNEKTFHKQELVIGFAPSGGVDIWDGQPGPLAVALG
jgi:hypothetical protein